MTPVVLPPLATAAANVAAPALPSLQSEAVLNAVVQAQLTDMTLRLLFGDGTLDLKTDLQLAPGTRVALALEGPASQPKLVLRPIPASSGQLAQQVVPRSSAAQPSNPPAVDPDGKPVAVGAGPRLVNLEASRTQPDPALAPRAASPATRLELSIEGPPARPRLVLRPLPELPGGAAPQTVPRSAATPSPNASAVGTVAKALPDGALRGPVAPAPDAIAPHSLAPHSLAPDAVAVAVKSVAALVGNATLRQGGLAPLYANLEAAFARPEVPPPVVAAARQLLALRLDIRAEVDADGIKNALLRSGLVTDPAQGVRPMPVDLRSALLDLRAALKNWLDATPTALREAMPTTPSTGESLGAARASGPVLPFRNTPTLPQLAVPATLPAEAAPAEMARQLLNETDAALARQTLLQIASLPEEASSGARPRGDASTHLTFDIPLTNGQGTAIAQMRIERDGAERTAEGDVPIWRVNFSINLEPIGPVHARIGLIGDRAAVTLKAERDESANRLARELPLLEAGLRSVDLEPGRLLCHAGTPQGSAAGPGHFLDQAT